MNDKTGRELQAGQFVIHWTGAIYKIVTVEELKDAFVHDSREYDLFLLSWEPERIRGRRAWGLTMKRAEDIEIVEKVK